jgi:uncharacterized protein YbjT (DUF2867 family)
MKVLVIGASGKTGRHAVRMLLARGDQVTALARNPASITEKHERLKVLTGDARDGASLECALAGQDAVLTALGPRSLKKDDLQEVFARNLIAAMKKTGLRRVVQLSALGTLETRDQVPLAFKVFRALLLKHMFADKERGERLLLDSDLDFVIVRPGRLTDGAARGGVKAALEPKDLKPVMTRADLAAFMVEQLSGATWSKKSPVIGY